MELKSNLKKFRMDKGLTQDDLGKELDLSGKVISKWESGYSMPDIDNVKKLCSIFDCEYADLIGPIKRGRGKKAKVLEEKKDVSLNQNDSKILKGFAKVLYIFARVYRVLLWIVIVLIILGIVAAPSIISRVTVSNKTISYKDFNGEVYSLTKENLSYSGNYLLIYKDRVIADNINFDSFKDVIDDLEKMTNTEMIVQAEIFFVLLLISSIISLLAVLNLEKLFKNICDNDTPFTMDNIHYLALVTGLLLSTYFCNFVISIFASNSKLINISNSISILRLGEIFGILILVYIFKYGYNMEKIVKGKIYFDNNQKEE